ncbi:MAG: hypothetical protein RLZ84_1605 [Actinomycetota bacterium]
MMRSIIVVMASSLFVTGVLVGAAPAAWGVLNSHKLEPVTLPVFEGLASRSQILDVNGVQIGVFESENSQPLAIEDVPVDVIAALLAVEDAGFYEHKGVNLRALVRATLANFQYSSSRQGASTITQQVVKNEFLAGMERDGRYKILQARYAVMLEKQVPKSKIIERYLNTVYFGNNAYGLQAASEVYFGKRVRDLSLVEGAFLAGLVRAPSSYDPIRNPEQSRRRFAQVLERLVETELITSAQSTDFYDTWQIPEILKNIPEQQVRRSYFSEMVRDYLLNKSNILGATYQERFNRLYRGGLRVHTTLDSKAQVLAEDAVKKQLPVNKTGITAALVSVDNATGAVRAVVGGPGFTAGRNEVNLALRRRQTGSSIKVFILAAALEAGDPGLPEEPFKITQGVSRPISTLEQQTWLSINCAYARLSQIVGLERLVQMVYRLSGSPYLSRDTFKISPFASFATGANELSPMDMASGMQALANGGLKFEPYLVERIENSSGLVWSHSATGTQVVAKAVADTEMSVLKGVMESGTARRSALAFGRPSAGKTGTQDENTNAWFVGSTRQLTTAVWVGDPRAYTPMVNIPEFRAVGVPRVQGSTFPARIWKAYMDPAHNNVAMTDWDAPSLAERNQVRLYLPGTDCVAKVVSGVLPRSLTGPTVATVVPVDGTTSTSTTSAVTTTTIPVSTTVLAPTQTVFAWPTPSGPPTLSTATTLPTTTIVSTTVPSTTVATTVPQNIPGQTTAITSSPPSTLGGPVVSVVDPGTTVPQTMTDPTYPIIGADPSRYLVYLCAKGVPSAVRTTVGAG